MPDSPDTSRRAELALVAVTIIWGATFVLIKEALSHVSTLLFLAMRFTTATAVLAFFLRRGLGRGSIRGGLITGLLLFAGYFLQTAGLRLTSPSKSAFITSLAVTMVPLLGALVYRMYPHVSEVVGAAVATIGLALLTLDSEALRLSAGDLLTVGCAVAFAGQIVALGHYSQETGYERLVVVQIGVPAVLASLTFWWAEQPFLRPTGTLWLAVAVTSLLATAVGFAVQTWAQRRTSANRAALIFALEPVAAAATSFAVAGEGLSARGLLGAGLILAGVVVVELKPVGSVTHPSK